MLETVVVGGLVDGDVATGDASKNIGMGPATRLGPGMVADVAIEEKITRTRDPSQAPFAVEEVLLCGK